MKSEIQGSLAQVEGMEAQPLLKAWRAAGAAGVQGEEKMKPWLVIHALELPPSSLSQSQPYVA